MESRFRLRRPDGSMRVLWRPFASFYWRIAISFIVFVVAVIVAQSAIISYRISVLNERDPSRSPNNVAAAAAAELGATLQKEPSLDVAAHLQEHYGATRYAIYAVMSDGRVAGNTDAPLDPAVRRVAETLLNRPGLDGTVTAVRVRGPMISAPIQVEGELKGLIVLPPARRGFWWDVGRWLSWPGTLLLIVGTVGAALFIFAPARRRLRALEEATNRLAGGGLEARAPESGDDEIARVARGFNRMARELAARDDALRRADHLRRQMLADVSHELKTPLTSMRGYIETLRMPDVVMDPERRARYFDIIDRQTRRLERIVNDLLDLARHEGGATPLEMRVFSIERLFRQVAGRHERETQERHIDVSVVVPDEADQITGDPDRLDQVVENLMTNAIRHTPDGGRIELRAEAGHGSVILQVVNTGDPIPPAHLPHVFERFYRADPARPGGGSSGLGLSIVKAIVERHAGTVGVTSEGGRTAFTVTLPQVEA